MIFYTLQNQNKYFIYIHFLVSEKNSSFKLLILFFYLYINMTSSKETIEINEDTSIEESIPENTIIYGDRFNYPNNWKGFCISFDDVDNYDFSKGFNEFIKKPKFVHLYFDFDSIINENNYIEAIEWLDTLKTVFGNYTIGGYSNNEEFSNKYGYKHIADNKHFLSVHVIFYETKILSEELMEIMKYTKLNGFKNYEIPTYADYNVYKLGTRQVFRHVLSDKRFSENEITYNAGFLLNNAKPSNHIIQIRGNEKLINKVEWLKVIPKKISKTEQRKVNNENIKVEKTIIKEKNQLSKKRVDDIIYEDTLIKFNKEEMQEFLNNFEPSFDNLMNTLAPLKNSPYTKEFLTENLLKWYGQREHSNGVDNVVIQQMNYYNYENSNKWFFSLLKHLDEKIKNQYLMKYQYPIDWDININNSNWAIEDILKKKYKLIQFGKLLSDLRGVIGFVMDRWYIKTYKESQYFISEINEEKMFKKLKSYKLIEGHISITLSSIVSKYSMVFKYNKVEISKSDNEYDINLFQGFKYQEIITDNFEILEPFLNHIKEVISNNNEEKYDYYLKWWANIIQNITVKNGTMPIIHGSQGSGKSIVAEIFCELIGCYALANVDDLDKVFGKFNGLIGRNLAININEPPDATEKFKYLGKIKSKLTQKKTVQETKGIDQIEIDSWANYHMTTNNSNPVQEEKGDRRLIYYETNNKYCGNREYFDRLMENIQLTKQCEYNKAFMGTLLHYMKTQINVENWDAEELIRKINSNTQCEYNENLEAQYLDLNSVDRYVVDNYKLFIDGIIIDDIKIEGYKSTGLGRKLKSICDSKRVIVDGKKTTKYILKPREQIMDLYNIIEYKDYEDENIEKISTNDGYVTE